jgi:hypothetical protein
MAEPVELGYRFGRKRLEWPLHMTLAPWFGASDFDAVDTRLKQIASAARPFTYAVGGTALFGAAKEVPVNLIEDNTALMILRQSLIDALHAENAAFVSDKFIGDAFRPHITRHEPTGKFVTEGETMLFDAFHAVRLHAKNICEVEKVYALGYNK